MEYSADTAFLDVFGLDLRYKEKVAFIKVGLKDFDNRQGVLNRFTSAARAYYAYSKMKRGVDAASFAQIQLFICVQEALGKRDLANRECAIETLLGQIETVSRSVRPAPTS